MSHILTPIRSEIAQLEPDLPSKPDPRRKSFKLTGCLFVHNYGVITYTDDVHQRGKKLCVSNK